MFTDQANGNDAEVGMTTGIQAAISGAMYIAGEAVPGDAGAFYGYNAADGARLGPAFRNGSSALIARAAQFAAEASGPYRSAPVEQRARFLELAADEIDAAGPAIVERAGLESGLPEGRLTGEVARTTGQLR